MKPITFSREETKALVGELQDYFRDELDQSIGAMPAEQLVAFFAERIGGYFYNRGVYDAQGVLKERMDSLHDDLYGLEQPTKHLR